MPPTAIITVIKDYIASHKSEIATAILAGLLTIVPDSWKPVITALLGITGSAIAAKHSAVSAVKAHLRRRGL